jgi:hypothetical protein
VQRLCNDSAIQNKFSSRRFYGELVTAGQFEELVLLSERIDIQEQLVRLQFTEQVSSE